MSLDIINKKHYPAVDLMKFVMALLVIIIHRKMFPNNMDFANFITGDVICRIAVPFFFMCSSFFLFKKIDPKDKISKTIVWHTEKRLIILYIIWSIIYIPCNFVKSFTGHYDEITLGGLLGQILVWIKNFFYDYSFIHLWYVYSLIVAFPIIYIALKKLSAKTLSIISFFISVVALIVNECIIDLDVFLPNPLLKLFISSGVCISLGALLAKSDLKFLINKKWTFFIINFTVMIIAGIFRYNSENRIFFVITELLAYITAFSVLIICVNSNIKSHSYYTTLRNYSTLMYFSHLMLMENGFRYISAKTGIEAIATNKPIMFLMAIVFTTTFSFIIINLSKTKGFKWLKWLY